MSALLSSSQIQLLTVWEDTRKLCRSKAEAWLARDDVHYLALNEPGITSLIIMTNRANDTSQLLAKILELVQAFKPRAKVDLISISSCN